MANVVRLDKGTSRWHERDRLCSILADRLARNLQAFRELGVNNEWQTHTTTHSFYHLQYHPPLLTISFDGDRRMIGCGMDIAQLAGTGHVKSREVWVYTDEMRSSRTFSVSAVADTLAERVRTSVLEAVQSHLSLLR